MQAVNYTTLRDNMKTYFDKIAEDKEPLIVTRKEENIIIMSQSHYDNIMETLHLVSNKSNYNHLMKSIKQYKSGKTKVHDIIEDYGE